MSMSSELLDEFCDALWLEEGLSRNTLESYRSDLSHFAAWLEREHHKGLLDAVQADVLSYLSHQFAAHMKATTSSRLLSSLRRFYRYQLRQGKIRSEERR